jgi:hypothetical protein
MGAAGFWNPTGAETYTPASRRAWVATGAGHHPPRKIVELGLPATSSAWTHARPVVLTFPQSNLSFRVQGQHQLRNSGLVYRVVAEHRRQAEHPKPGRFPAIVDGEPFPFMAGLGLERAL